VVLTIVVIAALAGSPANFVAPTIAIIATILLVGTWRKGTVTESTNAHGAATSAPHVPGPIEHAANQVAKAAGRQVQKVAPVKPARSLDQVLEEHAG